MEHPFSPEFLEKFALKRYLGRGGMGAVWLMHQVSLDRPVAVKVVGGIEMTPAERARLVHEARMLARLSHGAIVAVHDVGVDGAVPYMVCEYVDGEALDARLARPPRPSVGEALAVVLQVLGGLAYAHARNVVHRDVKPANVFLTREGDAKIGDFGIATVVDPDEDGSTGTVSGTPAYIAPELWRGRTATAASDLYAVGAVLFEMVSGRRAFAGPSLEDFIVQHTSPARVRPRDVAPDLPAALDEAVDRALRPEPEERFASAAEMARALERVRDALGDGARTLVVVPRAPVKADTVVSARAAAGLEVRVDSGTSRPAFHARWSFEVPSSAELDAAPPAGWVVKETGDDPFGHFSKLDVRTNERFRALAGALFRWRADATGVPVPVVYALDRARLKNRLRIETGTAALDLEGVELIPLTGGRALLGFRVSGGPCTLREYLGWASHRDFYKFKIVERTGRSKESLGFPRLVNMLAETWAARRAPDLALAPVRNALPSMKVAQLVLVGEDGGDAVRDMVRTLARPGGDVRYTRGDGPGQWTWTHPQAPGTRYGLSDRALTAFADPAIPFNRDLKPKVFLSAYFLAWCVANALPGVDGLDACWTEDLRRAFYQQCRAHARRQAAGS